MTMKHILTVLIVLLLAPLARLQAEPHTISLAGTWCLRLENPRRHEIGMSKQWFKETFAGDPAVLPGTLQVENRHTEAAVKPKIRPDSDDGLSGFTTLRSYRGASWYQREVDIPSGWAGKHIEMTMERCMWDSYVWVDEAFQGTRNSLATPHIYDLSKPLTPGRHRLTIAVDNSNYIQAMSGAAAAQSKAGERQQHDDDIVQPIRQPGRGDQTESRRQIRYRRASALEFGLDRHPGAIRVAGQRPGADRFGVCLSVGGSRQRAVETER